VTGKRAVALSSCLVLGACTGHQASTRLAQDMPGIEAVEIIHARFPCFSPDFHLYGYRFKVLSKKPEWSFGDICWDFPTRQWKWKMFPGYELSHLTPPTH
jgi:hypothetical protein